MDAVYYITSITMTLGLFVITILTAAYLIKPKLLTKVRFVKKRQSRKRIAAWGVFATLAVFFCFGSIISATEPDSVKQARVTEEARQKTTTQKLQQKLAEQERQRALDVEKPVVRTETKTEVIAHKTIEKPDSTIAKGESNISIEGTDGVRTITYEVTYVNGNETGRKKVSSEVTKEAIDKIVLVGTYVAPPRKAPTPAPQTHSSNEVVKMSRTGICHAPGSTYYSRTTHYTSYNSLSKCLSAGGRLPKR